MDIVLATRNRDKVREIQSILAPAGVELIELDNFEGAPDVVEDGATLEENALKKARVIRDATGICALADDTGLEVDALCGAPGVYSSRYAGEGVSYADNFRKLLVEMKGVPADERIARFRCIMALALVNSQAESVYTRIKELGQRVPGGEKRPDALVGEGIVEGRITTEARGSSGFGYDPVFEVAGTGKTLAEIPLEEKNRISHRYRALVEIREQLLLYGLAKRTET